MIKSYWAPGLWGVDREINSLSLSVSTMLRVEQLVLLQFLTIIIVRWWWYHCSLCYCLLTALPLLKPLMFVDCVSIIDHDSSSSFAFSHQARHSGLSIHFQQTLHLLSLLPLACHPSTHPNTSSLVYSVFFSLAAASPATFRPHSLRSDVSHDHTITALTVWPSVPFQCPSYALIPNLVVLVSATGSCLFCLFVIAAVSTPTFVAGLTTVLKIMPSIFTSALISHSSAVIFSADSIQHLPCSLPPCHNLHFPE